MSLFESLINRNLLIVTGKGGVGKSLVSAGLAKLAATAGRRVLLVEVDPRETQHELAGVAPSGGDYVKAGPNLYIQNLQPRRVFEAAVREHVHVDLLVRRVTHSPLFSHFVETAPGLKELAILGHPLRVIRGIEPTPFVETDLVVLDAPATGHGVSMLAAPKVASEVVDRGPFADMASELARFIDDPAVTGVVVVTLAEDMPVQEALEFRASLREKVGREPDLLVVNNVYPPAPPQFRADDGETGGTRGERVGGASSVEGPLRLWLRRRAINDRELARLAAQWLGPRVVLPLIPENRGPALLQRIVVPLKDELEAVPA